ncbi:MULTISPECIES: TrbM/KikA/MpfK family conjugal transfer protein [Citrobacter]|uniref:TrbM/KikA/MpfK family conjugal transfer protein n=1 Tax=Enterobacteriaceae TaxID=543 RepID=UPI000C229AB2|nr:MULTISPECIES: TrbM/KikA/MpfK family conjugal transfer protein [Citrobacter]EKW3526179.1 conjugal transfer protein [Raoultella planticola]ELY5842523.1 conjugal transfer protein [Cronobacter sakazakii]ATX95867.1 conjugal transfer protein [Citrobacter freundii]EKT8697621.1 conjugal transfer protein [Citrobacter freundii]MDM2812407.1 TrbM/KikA/MpfK family conjugal transfer protein [Citrobacter sp. Cpo103]
MKKAISSVLFLCVMALCSTSVLAADACEVVLCMYGKATGNGGGSECQSAERVFFNIVKKNKHGFLPDHTANARQSFLSECDSADPAAIGQIISKYGRVRD